MFKIPIHYVKVGKGYTKAELADRLIKMKDAGGQNLGEIQLKLSLLILTSDVSRHNPY